MRVIVRKERPHLGARLRLTRGQLPDLEMRNRRRARCDDRIRVVKDTGLHNLPLHGFGQNQIWCAIVQLAMELTTLMQMLALHGHPARRWDTNDCGFDCSRSPHASHITPAEPGSGSPHTPHGPNYSRWL
jgi:hypothetical protein